MFRVSFDPFCSGWDIFRGFMDCAGWGGRRFYTRKERIEELERIKKRLQREISGIDELIEDLKKQEAR
jgi:DNA-binding transcriptional MerR regulator